MSQKGRMVILEPVNGDRGLEAPVAELMRRLQDAVGTLMLVGGEFVVRADRVKLGELPGTPIPCAKCKGAGQRDYGQGMVDCRACKGAGAKDGPPEPISETVGFLLEWRNVPRLREEPLTARLMDAVLGPDEAEEGQPVTGAEVAAAVAEPDDDEIEDDDIEDAGDEPDEEE